MFSLWIASTSFIKRHQSFIQKNGKVFFSNLNWVFRDTFIFVFMSFKIMTLRCLCLEPFYAKHKRVSAVYNINTFLFILLFFKGRHFVIICLRCWIRQWTLFKRHPKWLNDIFIHVNTSWFKYWDRCVMQQFIFILVPIKKNSLWKI